MITFGVDALLFRRTATITVTVDPDVPSPLLPGEFTASSYDRLEVPASGSGRSMVPPHVEAVLSPEPGLWAVHDGDGDHLVGPFAQGAADGLYPRSVSGGRLRRGAGFFGSRQNVVVLARLSTFTLVDRPQFVALHLETTAQPGADITQAGIRSANLFAGDLLDSPPAPTGGTFAPMVLASTGPVELGIARGAVPPSRRLGSIEGRAAADLFSVDSIGQVFGARVEFTFSTHLLRDEGPYLPNRTGQASKAPPGLPGP